MDRVILLPFFFCFFSFCSIDCAPQFFGQLKPFYSFNTFRVVSPHGRDAENTIDVNARAPKPSSAPLRIASTAPTSTTTTPVPSTRPTTTTTTTTTKPSTTHAPATTTTEK